MMAFQKKWASGMDGKKGITKKIDLAMDIHRGNVGDAIDTAIALALNNAENKEEVIRHIEYIRDELKIFKRNLENDNER